MWFRIPLIQWTAHASLQLVMMTSSKGNIFRVTDPLWWGIHRSPVNSPHKGQWCGALMFSLICAWTNDWANHRDASDLRHNRDHYDVTAMCCKMRRLLTHNSRPSAMDFSPWYWLEMKNKQFGCIRVHSVDTGKYAQSEVAANVPCFVLMVKSLLENLTCSCIYLYNIHVDTIPSMLGFICVYFCEFSAEISWMK